MALACQHLGKCKPGCHNYRKPWQAMEERLVNRLGELAREEEEIIQALDLIEAHRKLLAEWEAKPQRDSGEVGRA